MKNKYERKYTRMSVRINITLRICHMSIIRCFLKRYTATKVNYFIINNRVLALQMTAIKIYQNIFNKGLLKSPQSQTMNYTCYSTFTQKFPHHFASVVFKLCFSSFFNSKKKFQFFFV